MKYGKVFIITFILSVIAAIVLGAGSITETRYVPTAIPKWEIHKMVLNWTADVNGNVSGISTNYPMDGFLYRVVTIPNSGTTCPNDAYDIVIYDSDTQDILLGLGANEPNSASNQFCPLLDRDDDANYIMPVAVHSQLELQVSNAGASKGGKVVLYWK